MAITPLPPAPEPSDTPQQFNSKAFAFVGALDTFVTEANAQAVQVEADASDANDAKIDAEAAAAAAVASANASKWVSGTTYDEGDVVWSPITYLSYRRKSTGGGTTDPSLDSTNWAQVAGTGDVTTTGAQTLSQKNFQDYSIEGSAIGNTGATRTIDLEVANFFSATLDEACAFTFSNPPGSGDFGCFVLELTNGGAFAITWPVAVDWPGGTAPTLTASGVDQLVFTTRDAGTTWFGFVAGLDIKSP
jgi:hypothetical protein